MKEGVLTNLKKLIGALFYFVYRNFKRRRYIPPSSIAFVPAMGGLILACDVLTDLLRNWITFLHKNFFQSGKSVLLGQAFHLPLRQLK
jgi:hypothetical protein